jgi:diguanylate cyclase (GGDEF)-like protein
MQATSRLALIALSGFAALVGAAAQHVGFIWVPLLPACAWVAPSLYLLRRQQLALQAAQSAHTAVQAERQMDRFRGTRRDILTGLPNRQSFADTIASLFAAGQSFAVLAIDIDGFDLLCANLGDAAGDELLIAFARSLQDGVPLGHACRLDGDSFGLILSHPDDVRDLQASTARTMATLRRPQNAAGQLVELTASAGAAIAFQHGQTSDTLLRAARLTLLAARQMGPARWAVCGTDVADMVLSRKTTRRDMLRAIDGGQIVPFYQPIVQLPSGEITTFEILARWNHPELGLLSADQFIPVADDLDLAGEISMALLRHVSEQTRDWPKWCRFAINVSAGQVRELIALLNSQPGEWQRRLDFSRLDVEISESALMCDRALARELIDTLHEHAARAVLDGFGTGQANFAHLQDLPFDSLKICKSFIQALPTDSRIEACVIAMLALGTALSVDIVADGVETEQAATRLGELGCQFAQGYFYAHPMPAEAAGRLLGVDAEYAELAAT